MCLGRVANRVGALFDHAAQQHTVIETRATDQEIVRRPLPSLVLPPRLAQPLAVGLETAGGKHTGTRLDALGRQLSPLNLTCRHMGRNEASVPQLNVGYRRVVAYLYAKVFGAAKVGIDQRLAAAHEEGVGPCGVQRTRQ
ncbi:hypothetical protein D3C81_925590 [compost metagenome]